MKLATLKTAARDGSRQAHRDGSRQAHRDGELLVVARDNKRAVKAAKICPSLREALEDWSVVRPKLAELSERLNAGALADEIVVDEAKLHSPLPRSFQWADGSAFLHHVKLVRQARKAEMPANLYKVPLMYQGGSDTFLAPREDIPQIDEKHGTDFEGEVAVITDDVPMGVSAEAALNHIVLLCLVNDVSLRGLIPEELAAGFGFLQSKPSSAFSPFALTPDELGPAWQNGRLHLPLLVNYNGEFFGRANAKEMHFHFGELIAHAARTRALAAGTIIGSGTVSNENADVGSSCLAEKRVIEQIQSGQIKTPFMKVGDTVEIKMLDDKGHDLFGTIKQRVTRPKT